MTAITGVTATIRPAAKMVKAPMAARPAAKMAMRPKKRPPISRNQTSGARFMPLNAPA